MNPVAVQLLIDRVVEDVVEEVCGCDCDGDGSVGFSGSVIGGLIGLPPGGGGPPLAQKMEHGMVKLGSFGNFGKCQSIRGSAGKPQSIMPPF